MTPALETQSVHTATSKAGAIAPAPSSNIDASTLPLAVLDLSDFDPVNKPEQSRQLADRLTKASNEVGFFYLTGLGIETEKIEEMFRISAEYFAEPAEEKTPYWMDQDHIGYMGIGGQSLDPSGITDNKEMYNMAKWGDQHPGYSNRKHPAVLKKYWTELEYYSRHFHSLALKCLQLIALGLRIPDSEGTPGYLAFEKAHSYDAPSGDTFRFLHYPPPVATTDRTEEQAGVRVGAHTDWGSITILFGDKTGGLQIQLPKTKEWVHVPPVPNACVVNLGDIIQFWSSGYLRSTMHRVVPSADPQYKYSRRYSIAYFARPAFATPLVPINSPLINTEKKVDGSEDIMAPAFRSDSGGVLTAGEWLLKRATKSFTKADK
ncbi:Clavaminate synthase-like protein [Gonapodya prolifera JEL478]|uniref:Clavaminate synthase-like protein n=1 Tax=Gonapodya prolifera (strain JEL478) TaxID=1344416 RepID=A0A139AQP6_GONPJ|nr:Clavaminate synthase-like protein [Gonapodya prolifera JEL478]|eukprot:KXS19048.1 Clavaminate synthase-like protein [Gonapodya prolifera JEL478]